MKVYRLTKVMICVFVSHYVVTCPLWLIYLEAKWASCWTKSLFAALVFDLYISDNLASGSAHLSVVLKDLFGVYIILIFPKTLWVCCSRADFFLIGFLTLDIMATWYFSPVPKLNHRRLKQWDEEKTKTLKRTQHTFLKEMDISPLSSFLPYQWWFDHRPVMLESWCAHWVCNRWKSQTGRLWLSLYTEPLLSSALLSLYSPLLPLHELFGGKGYEFKYLSVQQLSYSPPRLWIFPQKRENRCRCRPLHFKSYPN